MSSAKEDIKKELEKYAQKFNDPNELKLLTFDYPPELAREIKLRIEADRLRRKVEYESLNHQRSVELEANRHKISEQKTRIMHEIQELNLKLEGDYDQYREADFREQYLLDEKIKNYYLNVEQSKQE